MKQTTWTNVKAQTVQENKNKKFQFLVFYAIWMSFLLSFLRVQVIYSGCFLFFLTSALYRIVQRAFITLFARLICVWVWSREKSLFEVFIKLFELFRDKRRRKFKQKSNFMKKKTRKTLEILLWKSNFGFKFLRTWIYILQTSENFLIFIDISHHL